MRTFQIKIEKIPVYTHIGSGPNDKYIDGYQDSINFIYTDKVIFKKILTFNIYGAFTCTSMLQTYYREWIKKNV